VLALQRLPAIFAQLRTNLIADVCHVSAIKIAVAAAVTTAHAPDNFASDQNSSRRAYKISHFVAGFT